MAHGNTCSDVTTSLQKADDALAVRLINDDNASECIELQSGSIVFRFEQGTSWYTIADLYNSVLGQPIILDVPESDAATAHVQAIVRHLKALATLKSDWEASTMDTPQTFPPVQFPPVKVRLRVESITLGEVVLHVFFDDASTHTPLAYHEYRLRPGQEELLPGTLIDLGTAIIITSS
jgi:hypothetical protein